MPEPRYDEFGFPILSGGLTANLPGQKPTPTAAPSAPPPPPGPSIPEGATPLPGGGYMVFVPEVGDYAMFTPKTDSISGVTTMQLSGWREKEKTPGTSISLALPPSDEKSIGDVDLQSMLDAARAQGLPVSTDGVNWFIDSPTLGNRTVLTPSMVRGARRWAVGTGALPKGPAAPQLPAT